MLKDETDRLDRERTFHNEVFSDHRRRAVSVFYRLLEPAMRGYRHEVEESANDGRSLEFGCGPGDALWVDGGYAFDLSEEALVQARQQAARRGLRLRFCQADAERLPYRDESFDLIYGRAILHHMDSTTAAREIHRLLRPGGKAIFSEALGLNPLVNLFRRLTPRLRSDDEHPLTFKDFHVYRSYLSVNIRTYCFFWNGLLVMRKGSLPAARSSDTKSRG
jgi:SAM-dependent methyltransferase